MMKRLALASFALCVTATIALAQPPAPGKYDPAVEASYGGVITGVVSVVRPMARSACISISRRRPAPA